MSSPIAVSIQRRFAVSAARLFSAWTKPEDLRQWIAPNPVRDVQCNPRVGGNLVVSMVDGAGNPLELAGRFRDVVKPSRLSMSFVIGPPARRKLFGGRKDDDEGSLLTIEFTDLGPLVELSLLHEGLSEAEVASYERDWEHALERLNDLVDSEQRNYHDEFFQRVTQGNSFRSQFGGLWPDLSNADAILEGKLELGTLTEEEGQLFRHWIDNGYVSLGKIIPDELADALQDEIDTFWKDGKPGLHVEWWTETLQIDPIRPELRAKHHKLLDVYGYSETARDILRAPKLQNFLSKLFERPPMAFQSLLMNIGTEQEMHQDTGFVAMTSPMEFVGTWIALEDIEPGSGELQYFEGSHRIPEFLWLGRARACPRGHLLHQPFHDWLYAHAERLKLKLRQFRPKKGECLVWHADLVHGGAPITKEDSTRKSYVTHFCPNNVDPEWIDVTTNTGRQSLGPGMYYCHKYYDRG